MLSKSPVGNRHNSLIQSRLYGVPLQSDLSKAYLHMQVTKLDSLLRLFLWFDRDLNIQVYRRQSIDFGDPASALTLSIAQLKFLAPLVVYMASLLIIVFCKYADNYALYPKNKPEFEFVSKDPKKAHDKISLPLRFVCTDFKMSCL